MAKTDRILLVDDERKFPVMVIEFLQGINQPEMKRAFHELIKKEGITGHKSKEEWQRLYTLFQTKPVNVPWQIWQESNKEVASP
jgi:hypothetical protein